MLSDKTQELIDAKVRAILKAAYQTAKTIIETNKDLHEKIATALLTKEEIIREEFDKFFEGVAGVPEKAIV